MSKHKLKSPIPGVQVFLTNNPLNARIELSESAKREIALMITLNEMFDDVYSAHFDLLPQHNMQSISEGDNPVLRDNYNISKAKDSLLRVIDKWYGKDGDGDGWEGDLSSADRCLQDKRVQMWLEEINTEHSGDCTAIACSCTRCHMEGILGINTLPYGKMINARLSRYWFEEYASPQQKEEKLARVAEWNLKYPPQKWVPDEATKLRWAAEEITAQAAYAEHKELLLSQERSSRKPIV